MATVHISRFDLPITGPIAGPIVIPEPTIPIHLPLSELGAMSATTAYTNAMVPLLPPLCTIRKTSKAG